MPLISETTYNKMTTLVSDTRAIPNQYDYSGESKSNWLNLASGKYRALTCLPPKYRPSSSLTVFHAPAGPANNTKIRTASLESSGTGYTG